MHLDLIILTEYSSYTVAQNYRKSWGTEFINTTRRQRSDLFGLRVKLSSVTTSLTTQS